MRISDWSSDVCSSDLTFAAQIGAMRMNQETQAMKVMGIDLFDALVVPRVLALLVIMPLLAIVAMLAGLAGGLVVSWGILDVSPTYFAERLSAAVENGRASCRERVCQSV